MHANQIWPTLRKSYTIMYTFQKPLNVRGITRVLLVGLLITKGIGLLIMKGIELLIRKEIGLLIMRGIGLLIMKGIG